MDDLTLGVIYAIKAGGQYPRDNIIDFLSHYTGTPSGYYNNHRLEDILIKCFIDYIKSSDNPSFDLWQYFDSKAKNRMFGEMCPCQRASNEQKGLYIGTDADAITAMFRLTKVRNDKRYINGFRDWTYDDYFQN